MSDTAIYIPKVLQSHQHKLWRPFIAGKNIMLCCGRKAGKTVFLCICCVYTLTRLASKPERTRILFASYAYANLTEAYLVCCDFLKIAGVPFHAKQSPNMEIVVGNCICSFASMQSGDTRVSNIFHLILLDEAALCPDISVYRILPTQMRYNPEGSQIVMASTPRGNNWFKQRWDSGVDVRFQLSSYDSPYNHPNDIKKIEASMSRRAAQSEIYARFLAGDGCVFDVEQMQWWSGDDKQLLPNEKVVSIGIDLASRSDFTVMMPCTDYGRMISPKRIQRREWQAIIQHIKAYTLQYPKATVIADGTGLGSVVTDLLRPHIPNFVSLIFTNESKNKIVTDLEVAIEQKNVTFPNDKIVRDEFGSFGYSHSKTGKYTYGGQDGSHDDIVCAAMLAWHGRNRSNQLNGVSANAPKNLAVYSTSINPYTGN